MYNCLVQTGRAGYSWELLRQRLVRRLHSHAGWLIFGLGGGLVVLCYFLLRPFLFEEGLYAVRKVAMWLAAWTLAHSVLYQISAWLEPRALQEEQDLAHLPLPAGQHFLHRLQDLAAVPVVTMLLSLPLFWVALIYFGLPYGEGPGVSYWTSMNWWYSTSSADPDPWSIRLLLVCINLALAALLPVTAALLLEFALPWPLVRAGLLPLLCVGAYYLVRTYEVRYELFRIAYQQTRGYDPWDFIAVGALLFLTPFLLARMTQRARLALVICTALSALFGLGLILGQHRLPGADTTAMVRDAVGDLRFAIAYYLGHLSPAENIDLLFYNYPENVLFNDAYAHNLIPRHIALWVGAGLYPLLFCGWTWAAMWLGVASSKRRS